MTSFISFFGVLVPAPRAYWNGYLKFALLSCPVALYPATSAVEPLSFRQINRRTGNRLKHKLVDSVTGETVDSANKARGYEVGENEFLLVEDRDIDRARSPRPDELEIAKPPRVAGPTMTPGEEENAAEDDYEYEDEDPPTPRPQNTRTIDIDRFLSSGEIDPRYLEKPYYITPREEIGQEPFRSPPGRHET